MIHLGARVGALVDGQLPPAEAERWWAHVHGCDLCRRAVEREGWVKTRLAGAPAPEAPAGLRGSLTGVTAWPELEENPRERRRALVTAAVGAGSLGVALVGVLAVSVPANAPGLDRRAPAASLTRPSDAPRTTTPRIGHLREQLPSGHVLRDAAPIVLLPQIASALHEWVTMAP